MQGIMETIFDALYLSTVTFLGVRMIRRHGGRRQFLLFGIMAVVLGAGDAFHLIPRSFALLTDGLRSHAAALGIGKWITSVTMTIFYVILYHVWRLRYEVRGHQGLTAFVWALAAARIALCFFPQNAWTSADAPLSWGIYRNIPFAAMGVIMMVLFYRSAKEAGDAPFRFMWLTIALSFAFYVPVVLFADAFPLVGMLMIPKTLAYVWTVLIGYRAMMEQGVQEARA